MNHAASRGIGGGLLLAVTLLTPGCAHSNSTCDSCHSWSLFGACGGGCWHGRSHAIPETYPLGSTVRAHYHTMQSNTEAADFIVHRNEFVDSTAELTPDGKDHILEIAARMRSTPFPVVVERTENNSDPELDNHRRRLVAQILNDFGNPEADQRTVVAPAYGRGINGREAEFDYFRFIFSRGFGGFGGFGNNVGQFGGVGGGAGGGLGRFWGKKGGTAI